MLLYFSRVKDNERTLFIFVLKFIETLRGIFHKEN